MTSLKPAFERAAAPYHGLSPLAIMFWIVAIDHDRQRREKERRRKRQAHAQQQPRARPASAPRPF